MEPARVVSRRTFTYDGLQVVPGHVFTLGGFRNDEKLLRLLYVIPLAEGTELCQCALCGAEFVSLGARDAHGAARHRSARLVALVDEDDREEQRAERENAEAPLALENTLASRRP